jgi:flagellar protein FlgJ
MLDSASPSADLYLNMSQFSELKLQARNHSPEAAKAAAQQFEGLFLQMMLKDMRAAARVDDSLHSNSMDFYNDMYDKQLSQVLARAGGIGVAELLARQLGGEAPQRQTTAVAGGMTGTSLPTYRLNETFSGRSVLPLERMNYQADNPQVRAHPLSLDVASRDGEDSTALDSQAIAPFSGWADANEFVVDLWPHAERAAARLGVSPQVLVAQSALETGWGQHSMRDRDGHIAFSLYGIKAGDDWAGRSVTHNTLEFKQGAMQQESARFRAYDSVGEAMDDYVDFVQSRPHYQAALDHGGSDEAYIRGLHRGGYATDPRYADKILSILQGDTFRDAMVSIAANQGLS